MKRYTKNEVEELLEKQREEIAFALLMKSFRIEIDDNVLFEIRDLIINNKLDF